MDKVNIGTVAHVPRLVSTLENGVAPDRSLTQHFNCISGTSGVAASVPTDAKNICFDPHMTALRDTTIRLRIRVRMTVNEGELVERD